ncbi:MAG: amidohydrolase [Candidatus Eremiobacteraeota bacterium]|nr:amidohydrolase [Candidatus Eremiobacteraeota bacterium]
MSALDSEQLETKVIAWRREIHAHPELGFQEHRTSALVERELTAAGIDTMRMVTTGVVGTIKGTRPGKTLLLRADMDALPLDERSGESFSSTSPGVMHACGHDAHTAMLLGAAVSLAAQRDRIAGTIKFVFQPAEEGPGGAKPMIDAGVLENPRVDAAVMIHVLPLLETGVVGWRTGPMMASADEFRLEIGGRGGHAAAPHLGVDTIPVAAEIVGALQRITSREVDPLENVVLSIGTIHGGQRSNIIADRTELTGTVRCLNETVRTSIPQRIERIARGVCAAHGARCTLHYEMGYPSVQNDTRLVNLIADVLREAPDITRLVELPAPRMGAEDFAYFAQAVPGCMLRLGVGLPGERDPAMLHAAEFRLDERALRTGVSVFRELALRLPAIV